MAIRDFLRNLLSGTRTSAEELMEEANALSSRGDYDAAIERYSRAMRIRPGWAGAYNNRGNAYRHKGDFERALRDFAQAIQIRPDYSKPYNNRGLARSELGDLEGALADFSEAVRRSPGDWHARENRGLTYMKLRRYDDALTDFDYVIGMNPDVGSVHSYRGQLHLLRGEYEAAVTDCRHALERDRQCLGAMTALARAYEALNDLLEAMHWCQEALLHKARLPQTEVAELQGLLRRIQGALPARSAAT